MHSSTTLRLTLLPVDVPTYEAALAGMDELGHHLNIRVPAEFDPEFGLDPLRHSYDQVRSNADEAGWWTYLFITRQDQTLVGYGGYAGKPNEQGVVEIGYQIYVPHRGQGLATEAARGLIDRAFDEPVVNVVQAHTLAEENASVHVLKKCGMTFVRAIDHPEDGAIWQWRLERNKR